MRSLKTAGNRQRKAFAKGGSDAGDVQSLSLLCIVSSCYHQFLSLSGPVSSQSLNKPLIQEECSCGAARHSAPPALFVYHPYHPSLVIEHLAIPQIH